MSDSGSQGVETVQPTGGSETASAGQPSSTRSGTVNGNKEQPSGNNTCGKRMIFTGPDYLRQHRVTVPEDFMAVGIGERSPEFTSQINYLNHSAPNTPFPKSRNQYVGEVGWSVSFFGTQNA